MFRMRKDTTPFSVADADRLVHNMRSTDTHDDGLSHLAAKLDHLLHAMHIDMNCVVPEVAAVTHFWGRLVPGAPVLLDDYGSPGYEPQKHGMDAFARDHGVEILSLPTGQGMMIKP